MKLLYNTAGIVLAALLLFSACEYEKPDIFSGKEQVFFSYAEASVSKPAIIDSTMIRLGYDDPVKSDSAISIRLQIRGFVADYNRPVSFILVDSLSTAKLGEDIELLTDGSYIYADSIYGEAKVKIINTPKIADSTLVATIKMVGNEYFYADYNLTNDKTVNSAGKVRATEFRIFFHASNVMPNLWLANVKSFSTAFGEYSRVKLEFMCEVLEVTREFFTYDEETENPTELWNVRFRAFTTTWARILKAELIKYEAEHGDLIDENENKVTF